MHIDQLARQTKMKISRRKKNGAQTDCEQADEFSSEPEDGWDAEYKDQQDEQVL